MRPFPLFLVPSAVPDVLVHKICPRFLVRLLVSSTLRIREVRDDGYSVVLGDGVVKVDNQLGYLESGGRAGHAGEREPNALVAEGLLCCSSGMVTICAVRWCFLL